MIIFMSTRGKIKLLIFLIMTAEEGRCSKNLYQTKAAVTSGLLTIVKTGITIVSYFGNVTATLFVLTIVRKFTPR